MPLPQIGSEPRMQHVLVTGGAGFIGANFVRHLLRMFPEIQIVDLDALTYAGSRENLKNLPGEARHEFVHGDIRDRPLVDRLLREHDIDTIVHFAAESHVDRSILGPEPFVQTNVVGTFTLLEAARQYWLGGADRAPGRRRFHHVSTDEVYGSLSPGEPAFSEMTPYAPNSPYAASKAASDHLVRAYGHTYGLEVTISNCSNNYGPYQFPEKLIPLMILNALAGKPLPVYGDGQQIRDWLFVEDHCEAIRMILEHANPGETYNIGGGNQSSNLTIVHTLCDMLDEFRPAAASYRSLIRYVADRPGHDRRYAMDITKIRRDLDWAPRHSLSDGLQETVEWYLANDAWIEAIRAQTGFQSWMDRNYEKRQSAA
jgi:dTDP-glucose 4,6-dehydratase